MNPPDEWLLLLNFYLITCSGGTLCIDNFEDERLAQAYRENPREGFYDMDVTAAKLVLEFQGQKQDTGSQNGSPRLRGENEETPNGPISISLPSLPSYV